MVCPPATLLVPLSSDFALTSGKSFTVWLQVLVLYQGFPAPKSATDFLFQNNNTTSLLITTTGIEKVRGESKRESKRSGENRNGNRESNKRESKRSGENLAGIYGNLGVPGENLAGIYGNLEKDRGESQPVIEDGQGRISTGNRGWSGENLLFWSELNTPPCMLKKTL